MASDNPSFVDTENKGASRDAERVEGAVDTPPRIARPSGGEGKDESSAPTTTPLTGASKDRSAKTRMDPASPEDATQRSQSNQHETPETHENSSFVPEDGNDRRVSVDQESVKDAEKERNLDNGVLANGNAVKGSSVHAKSESLSKESSLKGWNATALNGAPGDAAKKDARDKGSALERADGHACERGAGAGAALPAYPPGEEGRMLRNALGVGVVFMVHFTATLGVTHLQSSVNKEKGLGTSALAAQYAGLVISSLIGSVFLISKLGCKWTMVVAILCNVPYMVAQTYPRVYTLVPAAFLMGLAVAPLWSAKCTYLCVVSEARAAATGRALAAVRDRVIGLFFMVFLLSMVWGNLVSSLVLSQGEGAPSNASVSGLCGVDFCPNSDAAKENPNLERPPQEKITLIIGIYIGFMLLAALVAATYVDSLKRYSEGSRASSATGLTTRGLLTATLALHRRKEMLLLMPLSIWLGVDYAFVEAEYTASFVACAWGIRNIGYVIICYGLANSALALATGWIVARFGRRPVLCTAALLHVALLAGVLAWRPSPDHKALFFVVAALWGAEDGHWAVQLNSLYAILFPNMEEAAYSNFRLWQSMGFVIAFSYSHYLCTAYKLYIVMALLAVGVAGYLGIEYTRPQKARLVDG